MTEFKLVGSHSEDLSDGRVVAPGEIVKGVDADDDHNKRLIEEGRLVEVTKPKPASRSQKKEDDA